VRTGAGPRALWWYSWFYSLLLFRRACALIARR